MAELARQGKLSMAVRAQALKLTAGALQKDYEEEARRLLKFTREDVRYVRDINGVETIHTAERILEMMAGDCDDKAVLLASMLESIGARCRFIAVAFSPGQWVHVWVQVNIRGRWVDLEPTEPCAYGKRVPDKPGASYLYEEV